DRAKPQDAKREPDRAKPQDAKREPDRAKPQDAKREPDRAKPQDAKREPDRAKPQDAKREPDRAKPQVTSDGDFDAGIARALSLVLFNPGFLFRVEADPERIQPGTNYRISDLELASRLSFFLWSSISDDELLDAAIRGELHRPDVLEKQARRMLAD